ncbi:MAG: malto-oligosyltrehalose trehalohydrolase, partial [Actinomycetales bacterium]
MARRDFDVWAPSATSVALTLDGSTVPLRGDADGWWRSQEPWRAGADYGYLLNGSTDARPDPRSLRQPGGVHSLSRSYDPASFGWTDGNWKGTGLTGAVIYELHLGTFTDEGTLDAAIGKLDYLVRLGATFVELLPVNDFNGSWNWGYDGVLWYAVHEAYGGPAAYQRFVDAAHAAGLGVIQDVVYNHLGPSGNYLPEFGPYLRSGSSNTWGELLNLDGPDSAQVRRYILDNALGWLSDFHVDGLRLDAVHALKDNSPVHLLAQLSDEAGALSARLGRPLTLIAESDLNDAAMVYPRADGGMGLGGQWSDDFHHALHVNLTGETAGYYADFAGLASLAKVLRDGFFHNGTYSSFRGTKHGAPIRPGTPAADLVVCMQDHDQIGNRAAGDRISATLSAAQLRLGAAVNLLSPFTPMLFMGEEYGATTPWQFFTSHPEAELGKATAEGRFAEFAKMGWDRGSVPDPQDPQTFRRSKLDWSEAESPAGAGLLGLYRQLTAFRRGHPELAAGSVGGAHVTLDDGG